MASTPAWRGESKRGVGPRKEAEVAPPALGKEATPPPPPVRASAQNAEISALHFGFLFHSQRSGWGISSRPNWLSVLSALPSSGHWEWQPGGGLSQGGPRDPARGSVTSHTGSPFCWPSGKETPHTSSRSQVLTQSPRIEGRTDIPFSRMGNQG